MQALASSNPKNERPRLDSQAQESGNFKLNNTKSNIGINSKRSDQLVKATSSISHVRRPSSKRKNDGIKVEDLDINQVLDAEKAMQRLGGQQLYMMMLPQYDSTSLMPQLTQLAREVSQKDWDQIKFFVHALKGPAGYIGASRLHYACYYMQKAHSDSDFDAMIDYYPLLVETAIEVRKHVYEYLAKSQGRGK